MAQQIDDSVEPDDPPARPRRRILRRILGVFLLLLFFALAVAWFWREEIADSFIKDELDKLGLEASYQIESIGPRRQVLTNVVVGDPAQPDLTIARVETSLVPRWPLAGIGRLRLVEPRIYGQYVDGQLSFGALDPLIFPEETGEPFAFPDMNLLIEDGRGLIESEFGDVGLKLEGGGNLQDGFSARLAAVSEELSLDGCEAGEVTFVGSAFVDAERPGLSGPIRIGSLDCPGIAFSSRELALTLDAQLDRNLDGLEGVASLSAGATRFADSTVDGLAGDSQFSWRDDALTSGYDLQLSGLSSPQLLADSLGLDGSARSREGFVRIEVEADVSGSGIRRGPMIDAAFANAEDAAGTTLAAPLLERFRQGLSSETPGSELLASFTVRSSDDELSIVVPEANWRGGSGSTLLALSRFQYSVANGGRGRFSGNFSTGGRNLPRITGRMESSADARDTLLRLRMAEYGAGTSKLAIPELLVTQRNDGSMVMQGDIMASGPVLGGTVTNLALPVSGNFSNKGILELWRDCTVIAYEGLVVSSLTLERQEHSICPVEGDAIVHVGPDETRIAAAIPDMRLEGLLGETPIQISGQALSLDLPDGIVGEQLTVLLGSPGYENRFEIGELVLDPAMGLGGTFARTDTYLASVPIDVLGASGNWRYMFGQLALTNASLRIEDRVAVRELKDDGEVVELQPRFEPLIARDAWLTLSGNLIDAEASLREPRSDNLVATARIRHDLGLEEGSAVLSISQLEFGDDLQPDTLSYYALGLVANAYGKIDGSATIAWDSETLASKGEFSTEKLDFAAAFGPVDGVSGTIEFTDLFNMVTAKDQVLNIQSFNPGIQVDRGSLQYEIRPDYLMVIHGGSWPFIGGTLEIEPTSTYLDRAEPRRYTLKLTGIDAAMFVQQLEFGNIAASGRFNGRVPLVFDKDGGRIDKGQLTSLPPGGNLSYLGSLQYEDMGAIANFAFQALRSLDFTEMDVFLDGSLAGEIVTRVRFEGIRQGEGASRNIITRQLARLPIRFNVNITAPFQELINLPSQLSDPSLIRDPRELGLLDEDGNPIQRQSAPAEVIIRPENEPGEDTDDEGDIQPSESENGS